MIDMEVTMQDMKVVVRNAMIESRGKLEAISACVQMLQNQISMS